MTADATPANTARPRVLVIDDDGLVLRMLRDTLESADMICLTAADGEKGLHAIETNPVDIVVTDILMPEKEGMETIRELRLRWPHIKILAISGGSPRMGVDVLGMAERLGADRTLEKPFLARDLVAVVNDMLRGSASG